MFEKAYTAIQSHMYVYVTLSNVGLLDIQVIPIYLNFHAHSSHSDSLWYIHVNMRQCDKCTWE